MHALLVCGGGEFGMAGAVLGAVDALAQVLDAHADREWLRRDHEAEAVEQLEGVAGGVADREDELGTVDRAGCAAVFNGDRGDRAAVCTDIGELGIKAHLAAEADQLLAEADDGMAQVVGADMGHGVVEDLVGRSVGDEVEEHLAGAVVLGAGVELAVRKSSRAALAELDIALGVEHAVGVKAVDGLDTVLDA